MRAVAGAFPHGTATPAVGRPVGPQAGPEAPPRWQVLARQAGMMSTCPAPGVEATQGEPVPAHCRLGKKSGGGKAGSSKVFTGFNCPCCSTHVCGRVRARVAKKLHDTPPRSETTPNAACTLAQHAQHESRFYVPALRAHQVRGGGQGSHPQLIMLVGLLRPPKAHRLLSLLERAARKLYARTHAVQTARTTAAAAAAAARLRRLYLPAPGARSPGVQARIQPPSTLPAAANQPGAVSQAAAAGSLAANPRLRRAGPGGEACRYQRPGTAASCWTQRGVL